MSDIAVEPAEVSDLSAASFEDLVAEMILSVKGGVRPPNGVLSHWRF